MQLKHEHKTDMDNSKSAPKEMDATDQAILKQLEGMMAVAQSRGLIDPPTTTTPQMAASPQLPSAEQQELKPLYLTEKEKHDIKAKMSQSEKNLAELRKKGISDMVQVRMMPPNQVMYARIMKWQKMMVTKGYAKKVEEADNQDAFVSMLADDAEMKAMADRIILDSMDFLSYTNCLTALLVAVTQKAIDDVDRLQ